MSFYATLSRFDVGKTTSKLVQVLDKLFWMIVLCCTSRLSIASKVLRVSSWHHIEILDWIVTPTVHGACTAPPLGFSGTERNPYRSKGLFYYTAGAQRMFMCVLYSHESFEHVQWVRTRRTQTSPMFTNVYRECVCMKARKCPEQRMNKALRTGCMWEGANSERYVST